MVNIKKKLSNIYKNLVITLFKIIYGKIIFVEKPQKDKEILVEEIKDENLRGPDNLKYLIIKIKMEEYLQILLKTLQLYLATEY